jgi:nucleotide-binding universal stress UspA family protein
VIDGEDRGSRQPNEELTMYRTIVVGVTNHDSALRSCRQALELAKAAKATVHLVCAVEPGTDQTAQTTRRRAEGLVESLRASSAQPIEVHVETAGAHDAILGVADRVRADLIVIGNQGLVRRGRLTSEVPALVLRGARCSVLTVDAATT